MSQQKGTSFKECRQRFQTEEACEAYLFEQRWPGRFVCPKCRGTGRYQFHKRREYVCKSCHRQSSITAGTVLHRTRLPLTVWFWAIYLAARGKRGYRQSSFPANWGYPIFLLYRSRTAMGQRDKDYILSGVIELDDAYFGAPKSNGKRGRGTNPTSTLVAVSLTGKGHPRFLKMQISQLDTESVGAVAQQTIRPGSRIHSDALGSFRAALQRAYVHHYQVFDKNNSALRWIRTLISNENPSS